MCFRIGFLLIPVLIGCGERTVTGGTPGSLTIDGNRYSEIQLGIHQIRGNEVLTLGFGVTDEEGKFRLLQNGAGGRLYLRPGEYRITVESIGPELAIPPDCLEPERTPLRVNWTGEENGLFLEVATKGGEAPETEGETSAE